MKKREPEIIKITISFLCPFCKEKVSQKIDTLDFTGWSYEGDEGHYADSGVNVGLLCPKCNKIIKASL